MADDYSGGADLFIYVGDNGFIASFGKDQIDAIKTTKTGDVITFVGKCDDGNFKDCVLEK